MDKIIKTAFSLQLKAFHWVGIIFCAVALLVISGVAIFGTISHTHAASGRDGRLVTIYDRGTKKVELTHAATVGDALKQAGIALDAHDAVQPSADTKLVAQNYNVNIYRARPVLVVDGNTRIKVMTAYQTPQQIAQSVGIHLDPEDEGIMSVASDSEMADGGAGLVMTIKRAVPVQLELYGSTSTVKTQGKTVSDMLKGLNVKLTSADHVSPSLTTPITPNMFVNVWRNGKQTITEQEAVPFTTKRIQSGDEPLGYDKVQTQGVNGLAKNTYQIDIEGGQVVSKVQIASIVIQQPVAQVEVMGVGLSGVNYSAAQTSIMAAAGVSSSDYQYAAYIVGHEDGSWCPTRWQGESGCPSDYVPNGGGGYGPGYGLCQATPGSKMASAGSDWETNPITQMKWCTGYAVSRYGSWYGAYTHWVAHHSW